jgi:hypothetical protein
MTTSTTVRTALAVAAIVTVPALVGIHAQTAGASPSDTSPRASSMTFLQKDGHLTFVDVAPKGGEMKPPSQGDVYVVSNKLLDASTKKKVGAAHIVCTTTVPGNKAVAVCDHVLAVPGGTLTGQSAFPLSKARQTMALTGGTGDYAGARGTITWDGSGSGELSSYTVTFLD